jgi:hypothetical protein
MIERIVVLLKVLSKVSNSLYMLRCSNRSYSARYTVVLVTSRDCNHITWFRNPASVSLLATFSHRTWIAGDFFHHLNSLKKRSKHSGCTFWKFSYKRKFFFLIHLLYAKSTLNSDRKLYKRRWCDQMRTWFSSHWKVIHCLAFTDCCREEREALIDSHRLLSREEKDVDRLSQIAAAKSALLRR